MGERVRRDVMRSSPEGVRPSADRLMRCVHSLIAGVMLTGLLVFSFGFPQFFGPYLDPIERPVIGGER